MCIPIPHRIEKVHPVPSRRGFTLLELLIVIAVIAVLVSLVVPAFIGVTQNVNNARVRTEISDLERGIAAFKLEYGIEPPSRITFFKSTDGGDGPGGLPGWDDDQRSKGLIRKMFPQFNFNGSGGIDSAAFPSTGLTPGRIVLSGAECLVFFLGGVRDSTTGPLIGFSKNPAAPFAPGGNRAGPFFEFDSLRLTGSALLPDADSDMAPEYVDSLAGQVTPYLYMSSDDGAGYHVENQVEQIDDLEVFGDANTRNILDVYRLSAGGAAWKANSHQIISPGADGEYGLWGGVYDANSADIQLGRRDLNNDGDFLDPGEDRRSERDNITNFSNGVLAP